MKNDINGCLAIMLAIMLAFTINYLVLGFMTWGICWLFHLEPCWRYVAVVPILWMFLFGSIKLLIKGV